MKGENSMTTQREIYRCNICGNIVEVLHPGATLSCCGKPMEQVQSRTNDGAREKHVPQVEKSRNAYRICIGSVPHPMTEEHFIQWVELVTESEVMRKEFLPGDKPEVTFRTDEHVLYARAYCNLHGLWYCECSRNACSMTHE